ncbi:MAG: S-layer homology domain-containing protein [Acidimicrobiales bacterium]
MSQHSFATSLRRRIAIVMAAMLALTLVPLAGPAGAQPAPAPDISTCDDAPDAGFTDTAGTGFETEIDCLAAFGVTTGTTATTYSPEVQVRRSQMALFYYRIGELAGLTWDTSDAGFTDLDGLDADFVDAINALANAGIVQGTSATEFSPQDNIRRSQMALFIDRFQGEIDFPYSDGFTGDDLFPDIDTLDSEARLAVNGIGSVGITQGDAAGNYVPNGFVSRQQMSAFIVRHLVENGFELPGADVTGVIIETTGFSAGDAVEEGDEYVISTGDDIVEVTFREDPEFYLNGVAATAGVFAASAGVGDQITYNEDEDSHDVSPQSEDDILTAGYTVGWDLDITNGGDPDDLTVADVSLIEPYSGTVMDTVALDDETDGDDPTYRVGNSTVTAEEFAAEISFGDTLTIEGYDDDTTQTVYRLQNGDITGGADITDPTADPMVIQVDTNGWVDAGVGPFGNDLEGVDQFELTQAGYDDDEQRFTAGGAPVDLSGLEDWVVDAEADADVDFIRLAYSRSGGVEQFVFTAVEADEDDEVESGSISGTYVGGTAVDGDPLTATAATLDIQVNGDVYTVTALSPPAGILVDGTIISSSELEAEIEAGASVTVMVEDDTQIDDTAMTVDADEDGDLVLITNP